MKKLYINNKDKFIVYHKQESLKNKPYYVVFLHGLMSDMNGNKAVAIEKYCLEKEYNFIRFDNFGHGESSGTFKEQTISDWLSGINTVIDKLTTGKILLIGSSMGAWIALLAAKLRSERIMGVITMAAAVDFTEELIWNNFTDEEKKIMIKDGICQVRGSNVDCNQSYPISYKLIEDGRKYLLLNNNSEEKINVSCRVIFIHGMKDIDVPYTISLRTVDKLQSEQAVIKLIKDADHKLSRQEDLQIIHNSIQELLDLT